MTAKRRLDDSWKAWLKENIERQCNPEELLGILLQNNFSTASIEECMGEHFPAHSSFLQDGAAPQGDLDYEALSLPRLTRPDNDPLVQQVLTNKVQLYTVENFLSAEECDEIIGLIKTSLRPSTITVEKPDDKYFRTSSTCDLSLMKDRTVKALDEKIACTLGIRPAYSEGIQGQHYEVGQEFKKHTDYFEPGTEEYVKFASAMGNRTWTFMVYLNTVPKGGGTHFYALKHTFQPVRGMAVVWNNLYSDGTVNYDTLHAGMPVTEGSKTIITKWFREKGHGPMFY